MVLALILGWTLAIALLTTDVKAEPFKSSSFDVWRIPEALAIDVPVGSMSDQFVYAANAVIPPSSTYPAFELHGASAFPTTQKIVLWNDTNPFTEGQCVNWINYQTGWDLRGNAIDWAEYINSEEYSDGAVIVLKLGPYWHLGITLDKGEDGIITYRSRNQDGKWVISDDQVHESSTLIAGYIQPETYR